MKRRKGFYEAEPLASSIARRDWQHTLERAEESGLPLQSRKGNTGLLFPARILAPVWEEGLRHIILAAIRYSMGRHTYTDSSIDKSKRPQDHSVDSPSDKFPVFCALAISRRAVSTPPYCANIWLNRVGLYLHSFFACIIFSRSSSSNVLVNSSM